jgi:hypothetical protein
VSERRAFDYVLVQVVPRVERDERLNVGVLLFCPAAAWLGFRWTLDEARLRALGPELDLPAVRAQLEAIAAVASGSRDGGPIAAMSPSERFHWLAAPRSTVVQPGPGHAGLCEAPEAALDHIFRTSVAPTPSH